jgi:hypothetical protein
MQGQKASKQHCGQTLAPLRLSQSYSLSFPFPSVNFISCTRFRSVSHSPLSLFYFSFISDGLQHCAPSLSSPIGYHFGCHASFTPFSSYVFRAQDSSHSSSHVRAVGYGTCFAILPRPSHRSSRLIASRLPHLILPHLRKQFLHPSVRSSSHASVFRPSGPVTDHRRRPCGG